MNELSRLERWGVGALASKAQTWAESTELSHDSSNNRFDASSNPVHVLDTQERAQLLRIERGAMIRAGIAGAVSGAVSAAAATWAAPLEAQEPVRYWGVVLGVSGVAAVIEIGYLYWDGVRAVRELARASGVRLYSGDTLQRGVALALARAALELPSPNSNVLSVDPYREATRWRVVLASLVYKAKIALTGFVAKALLRRAFGRLATRAALEAVAIPVTAVWNMVVCRWVIREARLRAMGPSLARELAAWLTTIDGTEVKLELVAWALGTSVVKNRQVHPNWSALVEELGLPAGLSESGRDLGDCTRFLGALKAAPGVERRAALRALIAAAILDGKVSRLELAWLEVTFAVAGYALPEKAVHDACKAFVAGNGWNAQAFEI